MGFYKVKFFNNFNRNIGSIEKNFINFGDDHDYKFGDRMINSLPENGVGVLDRGFASLEFLKKTAASKKYFVIRISKLYKLEFVQGSEYIKVGTGKNSPIV